MKVLVAIDSFKSSISSVTGSEAITEGVKEVYPNANVLSYPLADGGEGTIESLMNMKKGRLINKVVRGPLHEKVDASYGFIINEQTAVIEIAEACGLPLLEKNHLNPCKATSYGVGELILDAIKRDYRDFIIGLGGSATNDAGIGMLQALGFQFKDRSGKEVRFGEESLLNITSIDASGVNEYLKDCRFRIACDVNNPLYGTHGATYTFGPQKGLEADHLEVIDNEIQHFAAITKRELGIDLQAVQGGGAAGGLGAAFYGYTKSELKSGIELILETVNIEEELSDADFVITGEGKIDNQTPMGKVPWGVTKVAREYDVPVIALAGTVKPDKSLNDDLDVVFSITNGPNTLEKLMEPKKTFENLRFQTGQVFQLIKRIRK